MDPFDPHHQNGWIDDPADRVRLETVHQLGCPVGPAVRCACTPRLVLRAEGPVPRDRRANLDPWPHEFASGE